ncbi:MAG TPA: MAE_28990/MAE_18760 family HEPN-like nuclease [Tepidisphaeraceae bacterium]|jgi:hypothetical protein|nr:MAE_28990/MAE_18760 family HEPN-like nuclease [Tepidisphaeraceae bacterium]
MKNVTDQLEERRQEFSSYLRLLEHLEKRLLRHSEMTRRLGDLPTTDSFKAMKAAGFLMLYNTIEATIIAAVTELYKEIQGNGCALDQVSKHVQDLWIEQRFWIAPEEATPKTYRTRAAEMLRETMDGAALALTPRRLPISGNIDAEAVRRICSKHGCKLVVHRHARGGAELDTVKDQRNALAHGQKTFVECGQNYAASDINRISRECFNFLRGFVRSLEKFIAKAEYRA